MIHNFTLHNTDSQAFPVVISMPHSGTYVPANIKNRMINGAILANTDWFLPQLYDFFPNNGFTTIINNVNRYVVDPNRAINDNDETYQHKVIYDKNTFDKDLYLHPLTQQELNQRINLYYLPYRQMLDKLINEKISHFGYVYLLDLHSFAVYPYRTNETTADFVIGNDFGQTSNQKFQDKLTQQLHNRSFTVSDNDPFRGGNITRHYGKNKQVSATQLEIRYSTYIENRNFNEEIVDHVDEQLFSSTKDKLDFLIDFYKNLPSF